MIIDYIMVCYRTGDNTLTRPTTNAICAFTSIPQTYRTIENMISPFFRKLLAGTCTAIVGFNKISSLDCIIHSIENICNYVISNSIVIYN
jgi:hypothetical protein